MKINRTKNAVRNAAWGMVSKVTSMLLPFFCRTIFIKYLGSEYLGLNSLFTSILSVLSITELGFGSAVVFSMYRPIAEDDKATIRALLNVYRKIYRVVGTIILIAGLAVTPFLHYFIKGDPPSDINVYVLYLIYLANTVMSYFLYSYKASLFSAHHRTDVSSKREALLSFGSNIVQILTMIFIRNYYAYVIVVPLTTIASNIWNAVLAKKMYPDLEPEGTISKEMATGIKKRIAGLVSFKIYGVVFTTVDTIVISACIGLTPLAIYNNYYYLQNTIIGFMTILTASITAGVGNKMITNSREDNYKDFQKVTFMNAWMCSFCAVALVCLYNHFMTWWVGKELTFPTHTMLLMVLYFFLPRVSTMTYTYREAAGLWWEDRFRPLIATVVNLSVNLILVQFIGMDGVIISTLICTIFINIPWGSYILFKNYFHMKPWEYYGKLIIYIGVTAAVAGLTWLVCSLLPDTGLIPMLIKGVICLIIPNVLFLLVYHRMKEFKESKELFMRLTAGIRGRFKRS